MARSLTVATQTGGEEINADRTSDGIFLPAQPKPFGPDHRRAYRALLQWPIENGEGLQVLHYRPGAEYKPHYDYFDPPRTRHAHHHQRGGGAWHAGDVPNTPEGRRYHLP